MCCRLHCRCSGLLLFSSIDAVVKPDFNVLTAAIGANEWICHMLLFNLNQSILRTEKRRLCRSHSSRRKCERRCRFAAFDSVASKLARAVFSPMASSALFSYQ